MWPFHSHKWKDVDLRFTPPVKPTPRVRNVDVETVEKILWGFTYIVQECEDCGKRRSFELPGDHTK